MPVGKVGGDELNPRQILGESAVGGSEANRRLAAGEPDESDRLGVLIVRLVQFRAYLGFQYSHIGSHIVYFCNVSAGEREFPAFFVKEGGNEEMGPVSRFIY